MMTMNGSEAEGRFAARYEMACTAVDVIARRLSIAFLNANAALDCVPRVVEIMAEELKSVFPFS